LLVTKFKQKGKTNGNKSSNKKYPGTTTHANKVRENYFKKTVPAKYTVQTARRPRGAHARAGVYTGQSKRISQKADQHRTVSRLKKRKIKFIACTKRKQTKTS
jgi:hypothetical protein